MKSNEILTSNDLVAFHQLVNDNHVGAWVKSFTLRLDNGTKWVLDPVIHCNMFCLRKLGTKGETNKTRINLIFNPE